jgi:hypothetical protein
MIACSFLFFISGLLLQTDKSGAVKAYSHYDLAICTSHIFRKLTHPKLFLIGREIIIKMARVEACLPICN